VDLASLQQRLAAACELNVAGSREPHVAVMLPSFNVGATLLAHYSGRLGALEHRYLLGALMLPRIPGAEGVFVTCEAPAPEVLDYYFRLIPEHARGDAAGRLRVLEVPEPGDAPVAAKLLSNLDLLVQLREHIADRPAFIEPWNVGIEEVAFALAVQVPIRGTGPELRWLGFKSAGRRLFQDAGVPVAPGVEDVHSAADVRDAIEAIRAQRVGLKNLGSRLRAFAPSRRRVLGGQAACRYSWIKPPRMSARLTPSLGSWSRMRASPARGGR
jgi:hypothetical protein